MSEASINGVLKHLSKSSEKIASMERHLAAERRRRDLLLLKGTTAGLSTRALGAIAGISSPAVTYASTRPMAEQGDVRPEGREGMVTVYDSDDRYLGCMGRETWERMLVDTPEPEQGDVEALEIARTLVAEGRGYGTWENRLAEALIACSAALERIERERDEARCQLRQADQALDSEIARRKRAEGV